MPDRNLVSARVPRRSLRPILILFAALYSALPASGQDASSLPPSQISWGQNHVFPSVAKADGRDGSRWSSSLVVTNPLSYAVLVQFTDYVSGSGLMDIGVPPSASKSVDDLVTFLGLPDGVYAIDVFVRAASIDDLLLVPVVVRTFRNGGDGRVLGTTLPEKSWGVRTHTVPLDTRPNSRRALYVLASGNAVFDIRWFGASGPLSSQTGLDVQGLTRFPVPEDAVYATVVNTVDHDVSGFTGEPEIYAYSTGTDLVSGDTAILR
jgi:hypothetical protein